MINTIFVQVLLKAPDRGCYFKGRFCFKQFQKPKALFLWEFLEAQTGISIGVFLIFRPYLSSILTRVFG
jgi:hypothetical protein